MEERTVEQELERSPSLPAPMFALIGRDADLASLMTLLADRSVRLITLTGPGGVGKTRLAIQAAHTWAGIDPDGVVFLSLAHVRQAEIVVPMIAAAMRGADIGGTRIRSPLAEILAATRGRRVLLVLDNLEQVVGCGSLLTSILVEAPKLTILATSRETLRVTGERVFAVTPLAVPRQSRQTPLAVEEIAESPAVQLFIERALGWDALAAADMPRAILSPELGVMLARICRALDGVPLAIELMAARMRTTNTADLEVFLGSAIQAVPPSHIAPNPLQVGMRQAVQWSYDLLTPDEQRFFERIAVFAGGFPLEALPAVLPDTTEDDAVDLVLSLFDKSLLSTLVHPVHGMRLTMLETIRDFASECLVRRGEWDTMHERHARWCLDLAGDAFLQEGMWLGSPELQATLEREIDNLRAARDWAAQTGNDVLLARLCYALGAFWHASGRIREGYEWLVRLRERHSDRDLEPELRMRLAYRTGFTARHVGDLTMSLAAYEDMRTHADVLGDRPMVVAAITGMGLTAESSGDEETARSCFREALRQQRDLEDQRGLVSVLVNLGDAEYRNGDLEASRRHSEEAGTIADAIEERLMQCLAQGNLGQLALASNDLGAAWKIYQSALTIARDTQDGFLIADAIGGMAGVAAGRGAFELAGSLLGATHVLCERFGGVTVPHFGQLQAAHDIVESALTPEDFARFYTLGESWLIEDALRAIERMAPLQPTVTHPALPVRSKREPMMRPTRDALPHIALTRREGEVLRLVARGYADRDIGELLCISHRTVSGHVEHAFKKLQVRTRLEATMRAQLLGLI